MCRPQAYWQVMLKAWNEIIAFLARTLSMSLDGCFLSFYAAGKGFVNCRAEKIKVIVYTFKVEFALRISMSCHGDSCEGYFKWKY